MTDDHSDFLIKSAALLAKDLLGETRFLSNPCTEADSDDDLDLFFYSHFMKRQKLSEKNKSHTEVIAKNGRKRESRAFTSNKSRTPMFLKFLQECEDMTFENQFKMTRSTFQVRNVNYNDNKSDGIFCLIQFACFFFSILQQLSFLVTCTSTDSKH